VPLPTRRVALVCFLACGLACSGGPSRVGTDPGPPSRIVSLAPALTEILFALGLDDRVVGVTEFCDYPPRARKKTRVGGYVNPSVEAILALAPDLVLVSPAAGNREAALAIERAGVRLGVVDADDLAGTFAAIETVALLCGVEDRGIELAREVRARIDAVVARVSDRERVPALFCLQTEPLIVAGNGTLPAELLELAGGRNVVDVAGYPRLGVESLLDLAPEVIVHSRMDTAAPGVEAAARTFWARWPSIPAVREGRVHVIDASAALRPGPRVADAVELLAGILHPAPKEPGR